mgnify:CR=1 FL=1
MISLIKRNMLLFFKDKTSVFFSFMAVFVVLGLYVCFLGDMMIQPLKQDFPDTARELSDTDHGRNSGNCFADNLL